MTFIRSRIRPFFALAFLAAGCRTPMGVYRPTTENVASAPSGHAAALYEIPLGRRRGGQVEIWSEGVVGGGERPAFHLAVALRNDAAAPMILRPSDLSLALDAELPELRPRESTPLEAAARSSASATFHFPLPGRFRDDPPLAFEVAWAVGFGTATYRQTTRFTRERHRGVVPEPLDATSPLDRRYLDEPAGPAPVGVPIGPEP